MDVGEVLQELRRRWPGAATVAVLRDGKGRRNAVHRVDLGGARAVLKVARVGSLAVERAVAEHLGAALATGPGWLLLPDHGDGEEAPEDVALAAWGAAIGELHARTAGFRWTGDGPPVDVDHAVYRWRRGLDRLPVSLASLGVRLHRAALREADEVAGRLGDPEHRALTHGDAGPPNGILRGGRVVLLDWEVAGPRHRAFDWFPAVQRWLRAEPREWSAAAEAGFRDGYLIACPRAEEGLDAGVAAAAVAWASVAALTLPARLVCDADGGGGVGHRRRIHGAIAEAALRCDGRLPALSGELGRAADRLAARGWGR